MVGFRPEDASLAAPDEANAFSLKVMNVEDLGSDGYIYGNIITDGSAAEASTMMSDQNKLTTIRVNPRALPRSAIPSRSRSTRPRCTCSLRPPSCV